MNNFDYKAFTYDEDPMHIERAKIIADNIKQICRLNNDHVIADFGCGTGLLGLNFVNDVKQIDMYDNSTKMIEILKKKILEHNISNINAIHLDITNNIETIKDKYDAIMTLMTFHHIKNLKDALLKLSLMLKKSGKLIICDLDEEDGSYHPDKSAIHNGINQEELKKYAADLKLTLISSTIPYIINKLVNGNKRKYPVFMHVYEK
ncbi:class I SAM-dependent methyltransferase [Deferribacteraceae bacterium V6Fe1]|nr:class I SAM-dependent methyltransferase [Deferribacteraceae bacterium V6Fe1]